jgi:hypothetical protein
MKPLMFPGAAFSDLVSPDGEEGHYFNLDVGEGTASTVVWSKVRKWTYPRLCYSTQVIVSGSRSLSPACWLPSSMLLNGIMFGTSTGSPIVVPDLLNLRVFVRDDGTCLLSIDHSSIIGSRWLATVPTESLPWAAGISS